MGMSRARREEARAWQHLYGRRWRKARLDWLRDNPLCVACMQEGRVEPATVVHHSKAHKGDPLLFWDRRYWVSSCAPHHDSYEQAAERGNVRPLIGEDGWPVEDEQGDVGKGDVLVGKGQGDDE